METKCVMGTPTDKIAHVKKGIIHFNYVLEVGLFGKFLVITLQKTKLKILHRKFFLSKKQVFRKLPTGPKDRQDGSWLSP